MIIIKNNYNNIILSYHVFNHYHITWIMSYHIKSYHIISYHIICIYIYHLISYQIISFNHLYLSYHIKLKILSFQNQIRIISYDSYASYQIKLYHTIYHITWNHIRLLRVWCNGPWDWIELWRLDLNQRSNLIRWLYTSTPSSWLPVILSFTTACLPKEIERHFELEMWHVCKWVLVSCHFD